MSSRHPCVTDFHSSMGRRSPWMSGADPRMTAGNPSLARRPSGVARPGGRGYTLPAPASRRPKPMTMKMM